MTGKEIMKKIKIQMQENESLRHTRRIAASIMTELKIKGGIELPFLLQQPTAKTNEEAVSLLVIDAQKNYGIDTIPYEDALNLVERKLRGLQ